MKEIQDIIKTGYEKLLEAEELFIMNKIKYDPCFLLWIKSHYILYKKVETGSIVSIGATSSITMGYKNIIRRKSLSLLEKIRYYIEDILLSFRIKRIRRGE